ncbi:Chitinase class I [Bosea lupini]|uniref:Chitinase class I n=1 Tax=Bosea lupini TaxID=1036779 RepID=A0A1H7GL43_9HYPH|nr:glycoside hydrolase family 19 protein [Bosea lupini]SEK37702.1 Chitinase class I [Bosea lupini]
MTRQLNRTTLFAYLRRAPFGGRLSTAQVSGCERLLAACLAEGVTDRRQVAYVLASVFHETGGRMQPVREGFAESDAQAVARLDKAWAAGQLGKVKAPYWRDGWFGRGDIQLSHEENYRKLGRAIGVDLVKNRDRALDPKVSARVAVVGMRDGLFRYSKELSRPERLSDYFRPSGTNVVGARAIVNGGGDKAKLIAGYWKSFLDAIEAAEAAEVPADVAPAAAEPDDVPPSRSGSIGTVAVATGAGACSTLVAGISNPWALAALALILIAGGVGAWLLLTGRVTINRKVAA